MNILSAKIVLPLGKEGTDARHVFSVIWPGYINNCLSCTYKDRTKLKTVSTVYLVFLQSTQLNSLKEAIFSKTIFKFDKYFIKNQSIWKADSDSNTKKNKDFDIEGQILIYGVYCKKRYHNWNDFSSLSVHDNCCITTVRIWDLD